MSQTRVSIVVPTWNRCTLLRGALKSILDQDYDAFDVTVVDNASTDETMGMLASIDDPRLTYHRNETNIGLVGNFNKALSYNRSPYVTLFNDDDVMRPGFIRTLAAALDAHPSAGFVHCPADFIDDRGAPHVYREDRPMGPTRLMPSFEWLRRCVAGRCVMIAPSTAMFRASALPVAGWFDSPHTRNTIDMNLFVRIASDYDVMWLAGPLVQYRLHDGQYTGQTRQDIYQGLLGEWIDGIAHMLRSDRAADAQTRAWLSDRLLALHRRQAALRGDGPLADPLQQELIVRQELDALLPTDATVIAIDDQQWSHSGRVFGRPAATVVQIDGAYHGPPTNGAEAVREIEKLRLAGAQYLLFTCNTVWWLDLYEGLADHLDHHYLKLRETGRLVLYDLRERIAPPVVDADPQLAGAWALV